MKTMIKCMVKGFKGIGIQCQEMLAKIKARNPLFTALDALGPGEWS